MKKILLLFLIVLLSSCYGPVKEYESLGNATNSGVVHNPNCKYCKK